MRHVLNSNVVVARTLETKFASAHFRAGSLTKSTHVVRNGETIFPPSPRRRSGSIPLLTIATYCSTAMDPVFQRGDEELLGLYGISMAAQNGNNEATGAMKLQAAE